MYRQGVLSHQAISGEYALAGLWAHRISSDLSLPVPLIRASPALPGRAAQQGGAAERTLFNLAHPTGSRHYAIATPSNSLGRSAEQNMDTITNLPESGPLIAIGGAEDKTCRAIILSRIMSLAPESNKTVGVITTASSIPAEVFAGYRDVFTRLGADNVHDIRIRERAEADDAAHVQAIESCGVIFISGGDQMRLTNILGASRSLGAIRARHSAGAVVAGTSAGAACMSTTMVYGGPADDSLRKGAVKMSGGLAFAEGVIIDTHFLERGRFSRLMEVGATNPEYVGVGLGEDAAIQFLDGQTLEAFGPGHVVIVDSAQITGSNVYDLNEGEAVTVHNVIMHALIDGYGYDITNRKVLMPADLRAWKSERNIAYS